MNVTREDSAAPKGYVEVRDGADTKFLIPVYGDPETPMPQTPVYRIDEIWTVA